MIRRRRARAGCRLRRRRAAGISGAHQERRWPRHRIVAAECECLRGARPGGGAGRCRHRPGRISRPGVRCRDPQPDHPGHGKAARWCWSICCASGGARRFRCPISATGGCGCRCCSAGACRAPRRWIITGTTRPTSIFAPWPISSTWRARCGAVIDRAHALNEQRRRPRRDAARCLGPQFLGPGRDLPAAQKLSTVVIRTAGFEHAAARLAPRTGAGVAGA